MLGIVPAFGAVVGIPVGESHEARLADRELSVPGVTGLQRAPHFKDPGALTVVDRVGVSEHPQQAVLRPGAVVVFAGFRVGGPLVVEVAPGVVTEVPIAGARAGRAA